MKDRCEKSREIDIPREESPPIIEESLLDKYISLKEKKKKRETDHATVLTRLSGSPADSLE